ncbi:MAG: NADH-quinone oxidoreductase subunit N [Candidatus Aminicenantes bacterium]
MNNILATAPTVSLMAGSLIILLLEVFFPRKNKNHLAFTGVVFLIISAAFCILSWGKNYSFFSGYLILDQVSLFFLLILVITTFLVMLISMKYIDHQEMNFGEYYALLLLALTGGVIMVTSKDLVIIFLGLEVLSMSSYALAGLQRNNLKSGEAAVKYFLLGSFASAFLIYGIALLFGASKTTSIPSIMDAVQTGREITAIIGLGLVLVGFGFKIALVPFHMWTPDVYQGSPTPVTAFFSVIPKTAGFAVFVTLFTPYWESALYSEAFRNALWVLAVLTMMIGNILAIKQKNIKRMLAYSSIAHAGYILIAVLAKDNFSLLFYLTVYLFMNIGAFTAVTGLSRKGEEYLEIDQYAGIGFKYPWIGATLSVFLFSLAGFPPTGGFLAKFYVFSAAVRQDMIPLVIIGVIASLISVYYYLRIIVIMYMREPVHKIEIFVENPALFLVLFVCLYGVLQLGLFPGNVIIFIKQAVMSLPVL